MAGKKRLKIAIVNRSGPFDKEITGKSARQLGHLLQQHDCDVTYISVTKSNKSNAPEEVDDGSVKVRYVPLINLGTGSIGRMLASMLESKLLFWRSLFTFSHVMIVMTSPPMLNLWGIGLKRLTRRKIIFWTMDLYPEAFVSNGLVKESSSIYKYLLGVIYHNPPHAFITLGKQQESFLQKKYQSSQPYFILPCGIKKGVPDSIRPTWLRDEDAHKIKFCYAGNLGEAHDARFIVELARLLDPSKHCFYINLYGNKSKAVVEQIISLPVVRLIGYISYEQMQFVDVHVVSLLRQWDHVCVPSKAVSAICSGSVLLLNSSNNCDAWHMFHKASFWVEQNADEYKTSIPKTLSEINIASIDERKKAADLLAQQLHLLEEESFNEIVKYVKTIAV